MINKEIWKDVKGYEGIYMVSSLGRVKSVDRYVEYKNGNTKYMKGVVLSSIKQSTGYISANIYKNKKLKTMSVHRIVALNFIPNPNNYRCVNHKNSNREDNRVENLEWCTHKYNTQHSFDNGRTAWNKGKKCEQISISKRGSKNPAARKVKNLETNVVYDTLTEASIKMGIPIGTLKSRLTRQSGTNNLKYL